MKILLIGQVPPNFECWRKPGQEFAVIQPQISWVKALKLLNHRVKVFRYTDSWLLPNWLRISVYNFIQKNSPKFFQKWRMAINRGYKFIPENWIRSFKLSQLIDDFEPNRIIVSGGISELLPSPFRKAKKRGIPLYLFHGINPITDSTRFERDNARLFTWVVTNDSIHAKEWKKFGAKKTYCLPISAVDPEIQRKKRLKKMEKKRYGADVVFVGTLFSDRQRLLKQLVSRAYKLRVYGHVPPGLRLDPALKVIYGGEIWGEKVVTVFNAAKIVLNLVPPHMPVGGNLRTFEIPGCGAFQLTNRCPKEWFVVGKEVVIFKDLKDLKRKIKFYLGNSKKRREIAQAGYLRVKRDHTYKHRFQKWLKLPV